MNAELRTKTENDFEKDFKLMKFCVWKKRQWNMPGSIKTLDLCQLIKKCCLVTEPNYHTAK